MRTRARVLVAVVLVAVVLATIAFSPHVVGGSTLPPATPTSPTGRYSQGALLPSGRLVSPVGAITPLGDFPVAIAVSPAHDIAVVANSGQGEGGTDQGNESLQVVSLTSNPTAVVQTVEDHAAGQPTFYNAGLAFSPALSLAAPCEVSERPECKPVRQTCSQSTTVSDFELCRLYRHVDDRAVAPDAKDDGRADAVGDHVSL